MSEEVRAEVIEPEAVSVVCNAGSIAANFEAMEARVDAILADYEGWEPSSESTDDVKQCKQQRKYLNALAREIDERRKAVKREYLRPLDAFEERANAITGKVKSVSARLDEVVKIAEQAERDTKQAELESHYEAYAGLLVPVVPYQRLADARWLNKTTNIHKAMEELEAKVDRIAADWAALKAVPLEFRDEAEAVFFETLDIGQAVSRNARLVADRARIDEMQAAMAPEPEEKEAPLEAEFEEPVPMVMVINACTVSQAKEIGRFCGSIGVTGAFKRGTLAEVCRREFSNGCE